MTGRRKRASSHRPAVDGQRLRDLREKKGWRQWDLCTRAGLHPNELSGYELEHKDMMASTLVRICDALEVDADYLLRRTAKPRK